MSDFEELEVAEALEVGEDTPVSSGTEGDASVEPQVPTSGQQEGQGVTEEDQSHGQQGQGATEEAQSHEQQEGEGNVNDVESHQPQYGEAAAADPGTQEIRPPERRSSGDFDQDDATADEEAEDSPNLPDQLIITDTQFNSWALGLPIIVTIFNIITTSCNRFNQLSPLGFKIMCAALDIAIFFIVSTYLITMSIVNSSMFYADHIFIRISKIIETRLLLAARIVLRVVILLSNLWKRVRNQANNVRVYAFDVLRGLSPRTTQRLEQLLIELTALLVEQRDLTLGVIAYVTARVYEATLLKLFNIFKSVRDQVWRSRFNMFRYIQLSFRM